MTCYVGRVVDPPKPGRTGPTPSTDTPEHFIGHATPDNAPVVLRLGCGTPSGSEAACELEIVEKAHNGRSQVLKAIPLGDEAGVVTLDEGGYLPSWRDDEGAAGRHGVEELYRERGVHVVARWMRHDEDDGLGERVRKPFVGDLLDPDPRSAVRHNSKRSEVWVIALGSQPEPETGIGDRRADQLHRLDEGLDSPTRRRTGHQTHGRSVWERAWANVFGIGAVRGDDPSGIVESNELAEAHRGDNEELEPSDVLGEATLQGSGRGRIRGHPERRSLERWVVVDVEDDRSCPPVKQGKGVGDEELRRGEGRSTAPRPPPTADPCRRQRPSQSAPSPAAFDHRAGAEGELAEDVGAAQVAAPSPPALLGQDEPSSPAGGPSDFRGPNRPRLNAVADRPLLCG